MFCFANETKNWRIITAGKRGMYMLTRVSEQALEFNRQFIQDMLGTGKDNRHHLALAQKALHDIITQELTSRQKEILMMYYFEHRNTVEIGKILGISKSTVSRTMSRAKQRIYKHMRFTLIT
ncbi:MAG: sigma-70 family RNA polymerase sigma factor [Ruminococcus sp.]|nr:sigma-70 family RNA polymerase sigma factor [Ruminococcus sp.]